jgi:uncharacterized membrane protein
MPTTKYRLESFTDGVIAIIITIMVLSIPLPKSFEYMVLFRFFTSVSIYFLSFLVVGAFWNQHHQAFSYLEKSNQKIVASNLLFLFFLSLIPLFTKWVIENPGSLIPVIGYDIIYIIVVVFQSVIFRIIISKTNNEEMKQLVGAHKNLRKNSTESVKRLIILLMIIAAVIILSLFQPRIASIILIGIPVISAIFNFFSPEFPGIKQK